jgi:CCR4-NOT transcription complex subunit 6
VQRVLLVDFFFPSFFSTMKKKKKGQIFVCVFLRVVLAQQRMSFRDRGPNVSFHKFPTLSSADEKERQREQESNNGQNGDSSNSNADSVQINKNNEDYDDDGNDDVDDDNNNNNNESGKNSNNDNDENSSQMLSGGRRGGAQRATTSLKTLVSSKTLAEGGSGATPNVGDGGDESKEESWTGIDMSRMGLRVLSKKIGIYDSLTVLYLSHNSLQRIPGEIFAKLKNLTLLDLSYNMLSALPPEIGCLIQLKVLALYNNRISELPLEMGKLYNLQSLTLDGNPIVSPSPAVLQQGPEKIVAYLRDRMPPPSRPPDREWLSYTKNESYKGLRHRDLPSFRVLAYNVLADAYVNAERYAYCPSWALKWDYRKKLIVQRVAEQNADIVCLQEVETGQFAEFFKPELAALGYAGCFKPKSRAHIAGANRPRIDGCAIFYKSNRFRLVEQQLIEFQRLALSRHGDFAADADSDAEASGHERLISRDNIALVAVLDVLEKSTDDNGDGDGDGAASSSSSSAGAPTGHRIVLCNTHIHWDPELCDVKLMQTQLMLEELQTMLKTKSAPRPGQTGLIVCGDFNSQPDSGVYELLAKGQVSGEHSDFSNFDYGVYSKRGLRHRLNLESAYGKIGEPLFTNYTDNYVGVLDYIWYEASTLRAAGILKPVDVDIVTSQNYALPSPHFPSDHITLVSEFQFVDSDASKY